MMKIDYSGKVVLITGAGGAIGSSMAKVFAENGASVALCGRRLETLNPVAERIKEKGGKAEAYVLDVTDKLSCESAADKVASDFGGINVLINNAGINVGPDGRKPIHEFDDKNWENIINVDLNGVFNCTKAIVPYIIKLGGGNILNISSVVGLVPFRNQCAFTAAKAGVVNLTKAMALELAPDNIRVNVICPGSIMFEGTKALFYSDKAKAEAMLSHIPQHRPGNPEDIAYAALYASSDEASYMTGSVLTIDGGWTAGYARDF